MPSPKRPSSSPPVISRIQPYLLRSRVKKPNLNTGCSLKPVAKFVDKSVRANSSLTTKQNLSANASAVKKQVAPSTSLRQRNQIVLKPPDKKSPTPCSGSGHTPTSSPKAYTSVTPHLLPLPSPDSPKYCFFTPLPHSSDDCTEGKNSTPLTPKMPSPDPHFTSMGTQTDPELDIIIQRDSLICKITDLDKINSELSNTNISLEIKIHELNNQVKDLKSALASKSNEMAGVDLGNINSELANTNISLVDKTHELNVKVKDLKNALANKSIEIAGSLKSFRVTNSKINRLIRRSKSLVENLNCIDSLMPSQLKRPISHGSSLNPSCKNSKWGTSKKKEVLLLSSSHGRNLAACFKQFHETNDTINCTSIFKPNAKLESVIESIVQLTKDFDENDSILIIGGTNNFQPDRSGKLITNASSLVDFNFIDFLISSVRKPRIFFHQLLPRYDLNYLAEQKFSEYRSDFNMKLANISEKHHNVSIINAEYLNKFNFTRHGLHLNMSGKKKLIRHFSLNFLTAVSQLMDELPPQVGNLEEFQNIHSKVQVKCSDSNTPPTEVNFQVGLTTM